MCFTFEQLMTERPTNPRRADRHVYAGWRGERAAEGVTVTDDRCALPGRGTEVFTQLVDND